jgi:hypothetical protein
LSQQSLHFPVIPGTPQAEDREAPETADRRRRLVIVVVAVAVAVLVAALAAARFVKSPGQRAAEAGAPPRSVITTPVESRRLADTVILRGRVAAAQSVDIPASADGKSDGESAVSGVVTDVRVKIGDAVNGGQVLMEISGRPVFVLQGAIPAYRDLKPGSSGKDVEQLRKALAALGLRTDADAPGAFGNATRDAVAALYGRLGYTAPQSSADDGKADPKGGAMLPASEVVFLDRFPGRVNAVNARVGGPVQERSVNVSAGELVVKGALSAYDKGLVRNGMPVKVLVESTGAEIAGSVASVAEAPLVPSGADGEGKDPGQGRSYELLVAPGQRLDPQLVDVEVRLTVEAAASAGPVLVVPLAAVSTGADGKTTVTVAAADGAKRRVEVRVGLTGDGYVEVAPLAGGRLQAGERVVVGVGGSGTAPGKGTK